MKVQKVIASKPQVSVAKGVVELDLCEVGGSQTLRQFWHHYVWPSSIKDPFEDVWGGCWGVVDDIRSFFDEAAANWQQHYQAMGVDYSTMAPTAQKTNMKMEEQPFEDVSPIKNGVVVPIVILVSGGV